jgi:hypothetical protein
MRIEKQLAVFLANRPGTLAQVCRHLAKAKINILAMTVADTVDHAVVRLVVSDPHKALHLLGDAGVLVVESDVLAIHLSNKPGALARVARKLAAAKVNIEYAYAAVAPTQKEGLIVIRPSDLRKAVKVLRA